MTALGTTTARTKTKVIKEGHSLYHSAVANLKCNITGQWKSGANILNLPTRTEVEEEHQLSRGSLATIIGRSEGYWENLSQHATAQKGEIFK